MTTTAATALRKDGQPEQCLVKASGLAWCRHRSVWNMGVAAFAYPPWLDPWQRSTGCKICLHEPATFPARAHQIESPVHPGCGPLAKRGAIPQMLPHRPAARLNGVENVNL